MSRAANSVPGKGKRGGLALLQLFFAIGFLALLWFSFGQNVLAPRRQQGEGVPQKWGALELVSSIEGPEALAQVNKLHGTDIELVSVFIVEYAHAQNPYHSGNERVTVWVGRAGSADAAAELIRRMAEGIERGGSGFSNPQWLTIAGHDVFQVEGPGGKHFFWNSGEPREKVVWMTVEAGDAMLLLEQAVETF